MGRLLRATLLGVGAMNSPRYAPAGLLVRYARRAVAFDGGPGASPPPGRLDAWLVTDEHAELRAELRHLAASHALRPTMADFASGDLDVRAHPVVHTSHETCGYAIRVGDRLVVWAPEFLVFPEWAAGADLMFAEAAGWGRPIRFRGGVGGHASVQEVARDAARCSVRRLVYAHIGRPTIRAIDSGAHPPFGEWGAEGRTYACAPTESRI